MEKPPHQLRLIGLGKKPDSEIASLIMPAPIGICNLLRDVRRSNVTNKKKNEIDFSWMKSK